MMEALVADATRDGDFELAGLVDETLPMDLQGGMRRIVVPRGGEVAALVAAAREADGVILVAPETSDVLALRVEAVRAVGGTVLGPSTPFIRRAAGRSGWPCAPSRPSSAGIPTAPGRAGSESI